MLPLARKAKYYFRFIFTYLKWMLMITRVFARSYKEPSILSGSGAAIWLETYFGPTGHHHLQSSPLPHICRVLRISYILNWFCKSCSVRVFSTACDHLNCVKMAAFQSYLQSRKQRKVGWVGWQQSRCFWWKRKYETVCCYDGTKYNAVSLSDPSWNCNRTHNSK
jgi:hypothetical protein